MIVVRPARRLPVLIWSAAVVAAGCLAAAGATAAVRPVPRPLLLAGCLALLYAGTRFHLSIRFGAQRVELAWGEAGVVLALAFVPAPWVVLLTPAAVLLHWAGRQPAVKTVYNVAIYTAAAAAAAVIATLAGVTRPVGGADLLVLTAAGVVSGLITHVAVAVVIAVVQDVSVWATWRASAGLQVLTLAGNLGIAAGVLILARHDPRLVVALPPIALCLHQGYVGRLRGYQERVAGQRKSVAVGRLTADLDEPGVVRRAAEEAAGLTAADIVEVELAATADAPGALYRHHRGRDPWLGAPGEAPPLPARRVAQVAISGDGRAPVGELRVWLASGAPDLRLHDRDEQALQILATTTAAALGNARAHALQTRLASTDRLTGLPTRPVLLERVESTVHTQPRGRLTPVALLVIDLSGYRDIIRTLGHDLAEHLLVRTGSQLREALADGEYLAHIGADDFGVYLDDARGPAHVRTRAVRLLAAVAEPYPLDIGTVTLDAAAGIAYSPTPVVSGAELLRQAVVALDHARAEEIPVKFYDPAADALGGPSAVVLASELHAALDEGDQLLLEYQPIVAIPSGAPIAVEALVRWMHPTRGMLFPPEFMAVLEHSPDHGRFVQWQLDQALHTRANWGGRNVPVSINLASRCLLDRSFPEQVTAALDRAGLAADQLMIELAETDTMTSAFPILAVLTELRLLGVQVALDKFGAGFSSLTGLLRLPATHVKIDSEFVHDLLNNNERAAAVVRVAVEFGRSWDMHLVALGVPSDDHVAALTRLGCDAAQGRHLAAPMSAHLLPDYLDNAPAAPPPPDAHVITLDSRRLPPPT